MFHQQEEERLSPVFKLGKVALIGSPAQHHDGLAPTSGGPANNLLVGISQNGEEWRIRIGEKESGKKSHIMAMEKRIYFSAIADERQHCHACV